MQGNKVRQTRARIGIKAAIGLIKDPQACPYPLPHILLDLLSAIALKRRTESEDTFVSLIALLFSLRFDYAGAQEASHHHRRDIQTSVCSA